MTTTFSKYSQRKPELNYKYIYSDFQTYDRIRQICKEFVSMPFREYTPEIWIYWDDVECKYVIRLGYEPSADIADDLDYLQNSVTYQH